MCCGHTFCKSCLDNAREVIGIFPQWDHLGVCNVCPMCHAEDFNTVPNKKIAMQRSNGPSRFLH